MSKGLYILFILMVSCRPVAFLVMGVKKPRVENAESLDHFLRQDGRHVISTYNGFFSNCSELGFTTVHIFSKEGRSLSLGINEKNACGPDPAPFIRAMNRDQRYTLSSDSLVLDSITARLLLPNGSCFQYKAPDSVDFVAVITWAKWIGKKILKRDVYPSMQAVVENKQAVFDLIMVNLDKQSVWGQELLEKVKFTKMSLEISK